MERLETQDIVGVKSRISWSPIFAGAATALAVYLLWSTLGVAIGLSMTNSMGDRELGIGAAIWAVAALLLSLFVGGLVASQFTVGENKNEAILYGVMVWSVVFTGLLFLMGSGVRLGFNAMMSVASSPATGVIAERVTVEDMQQLGMTEEQIQRFQNRAENLPAELRARAMDPRTRSAAWWTFGGLLVSMLSSVLGAWAGAGPYLRLLFLGGLQTRRVVVSEREAVLR